MTTAAKPETKHPSNPDAWAKYLRTGKAEAHAQFTAPHGDTMTFNGDGVLVGVIPENAAVDMTNADPYIALFGEPMTSAQAAEAITRELDPAKPETAFALYTPFAGFTADDRFLYELGFNDRAMLDGKGTRFEAQIAESGAFKDDGTIDTGAAQTVLDQIRRDNAAEIDELKLEAASERTAALARFEAAKVAIARNQAPSPRPIETDLQRQIREASEAASNRPDEPGAGVSTETKLWDTPAPADHVPAKDVPAILATAVSSKSSGVVFTNAPNGLRHMAVRAASGAGWQRFAGEPGATWENFGHAVDRWFHYKAAQ